MENDKEYCRTCHKELDHGHPNDHCSQKCLDKEMDELRANELLDEHNKEKK
jgi:hypothetical protein